MNVWLYVPLHLLMWAERRYGRSPLREALVFGLWTPFVGVCIVVLVYALKGAL